MTRSPTTVSIPRGNEVCSKEIFGLGIDLSVSQWMSGQRKCDNIHNRKLVNSNKTRKFCHLWQQG